METSTSGRRWCSVSWHISACRIERCSHWDCPGSTCPDLGSKLDHPWREGHSFLLSVPNIGSDWVGNERLLRSMRSEPLTRQPASFQEEANNCEQHSMMDTNLVLACRHVERTLPLAFLHSALSSKPLQPMLRLLGAPML